MISVCVSLYDEEGDYIIRQYVDGKLEYEIWDLGRDPRNVMYHNLTVLKMIGPGRDMNLPRIMDEQELPCWWAMT